MKEHKTLNNFIQDLECNATNGTENFCYISEKKLLALKELSKRGYQEYNQLEEDNNNQDCFISCLYNKDKKEYTITLKEMQKIERKLKERFELKKQNKQLKEDNPYQKIVEELKEYVDFEERLTKETYEKYENDNINVYYHASYKVIQDKTKELENKYLGVDKQ